MIEQIYKIIVNSNKKNKLVLQLGKTKSKELAIKFKKKEQDLTLAIKGIKITFLEITDLNIEVEDSYKVETNNVILKRMNSVIKKIKENKIIIDNKNNNLKITEKGDLFYKTNIRICERCENLLESDSKYCKICGAKILK